MQGTLVALASAAVPAAGAALQGQEGSRVELQAVRFYRGDSAETLVDVFCRVPVVQLTAFAGKRDSAAYRISVWVHDSTGLELVRPQSWSQLLGASVLEARGASLVEHFAFAAKPGRYTIGVTATDSASGRTSEQRAEVRAFAAAPSASDLLLASSLRPATETMSPRAGEIRKGALLVETSGRPRLTPHRSALAYYLELYPRHPEPATVTARVRGVEGKQIVATAPQQIQIGAEGGVTHGVLDLGGLPPGSYRLEVAVATPDSEVARSAEFTMTGFEPEAAPAPVALHDRFGALSEAELDSLYLPLIYLMKAQEQGTYSGLTVDGKRAFLRRFWASRDPTPGTQENEFEEEFYKLIAEANRRFREGGTAEVPGWRTDRGRVFIRYGAPDEVLDRSQAASSRPYVVWKYTKARRRKFVFLDVTLFGHYELIWTDESREPSRPNWRELLGLDAVNDAMRF